MTKTGSFIAAANDFTPKQPIKPTSKHHLAHQSEYHQWMRTQAPVCKGKSDRGLKLPEYPVYELDDAGGEAAGELINSNKS